MHITSAQPCTPVSKQKLQILSLEITQDVALFMLRPGFFIYPENGHDSHKQASLTGNSEP